MISIKEIRRTAALLPVIALLPACAALEDFLAPLGESESAAPEPVPVAERPVVDPINATRFVMESPDQSVVGEPQIVHTRAEHTFSDIAREYGLGYDELVEANADVDPWLPGEGTEVLLPTQFILPDVPREGIVLNIASKRLFYFPVSAEGEPQVVMTYPIGIGRVGWETPLGSSSVISKARDPHWYVPASVRREHEEMGDPLPAVVPPGPENPLGRHVLKLGIPGYLIHGTNQPYGVGMRVSHGCVRLYPENIEHLYELVGIGVPVTIVNEPFLAGSRDGQVYFEGHPPLEDDVVNADTRLADLLERVEALGSELGIAIDPAEMVAVAREGRGVPVVMSGNRSNTIDARALVVHNRVELDPDLPTLDEVRAILDEPLAEEAVSETGTAREEETIKQAPDAEEPTVADKMPVRGDLSEVP